MKKSIGIESIVLVREARSVFLAQDGSGASPALAAAITFF